MFEYLKTKFSIFFALAIMFAGLFPSFSFALQNSFETQNSKAEMFYVGYNNETEEHDFVLKIELEDGWHTYWRNAGESGLPLRLSVNELNGENVEKNIKILWPYPSRISEYGINTHGYFDEVLFPIKINLKIPELLTFNIDYMVCSDVCVPVSGKVLVSTKKVDEQANELSTQAMAKIPSDKTGGFIEIAKASYENNKLTIEVVSKLEGNEREFKNPDLFLEGNLPAFPTPEITNQKNNGRVIFEFDYSENPSANISPDKISYTFTDSGRSFYFASKENLNSEATEGSAANSEVFEGLSLATILLFAFLGGLILNVMPCVLPVLSLKIISFLKLSGEHKKEIRKSFFNASLGILFSFLVLATITISLKYAGKSVGWGFHFQEPFFILSLAFILVIFACNMWGMFEFSLPQFIGGRIGSSMPAKNNQPSFWKDFLSGALATLLATPCTAPFLGTAIGFAISGDSYDILITFMIMGLGLATPYLIFAIFPSLMRFMPKAGSWMNWMKIVLGWFLLLTAAWLIWVLSGQLGAYTALIAAVSLIAIILKLWLLKEHPLLGRGHFKALFILLVASFVFISTGRMEKQSPVHHVNSEIWLPFDESKISSYVQDGRIVFIDVTADWCVTCKANKLLVTETPEILSFMRDNNVIMIQADWTNRDSNISAYLAKHQRYGIPFNVVYSPFYPEGFVLPELLSKQAVKDAVSKAGGSK